MVERGLHRRCKAVSIVQPAIRKVVAVHDLMRIVACLILLVASVSGFYFETALDLSFCVRDTSDQKQPGFYLIKAMRSEQAGLTGPKGSVVRKAAVGRSVSNLENALRSTRNTLETNQ
jgi:hypothetical protein